MTIKWKQPQRLMNVQRKAGIFSHLQDLLFTRSKKEKERYEGLYNL